MVVALVPDAPVPRATDHHAENQTDDRTATMEEKAAAPAQLLSGLRILDLTNVLSGPFCTYQMALLGAEVIKIEPPISGDLARQLGADASLNAELMGTSFIAQNAGKKSLTLDLKSQEGKDLFKRLVTTADAVVENFRPGVMARLDLDYTVLAKINPKLVYCAISGFGQEGPLKDNPAYDQIIQGMSGVMSVTGDERSAPLRVGYPICDTIGGITAAFATISALYECKTSGKGRAIDVSMLDSDACRFGLGGLELFDGGDRATRHGQREYDGGALRHFFHRGRLTQYRRQQAETIRGALSADWPSGTCYGSKICPARRSQAESPASQDRA